MPNIDSERYVDAVSRTTVDGKERWFQWCKRVRCMHRIFMQEDIHFTHDTTSYIERKWRLDGDAVVVSLDDGVRRAFCSRKCAALWLNSQER
jgi:NAD-dependent dihydropyrimidine dehydrogenase PreA subunit